MRPVHEIIVHCSATRPEWMQGMPLYQKVAEIRRWHVQGNGWSDIGYHYLIDRDGSVMDGRPIERAGAHTRGHNTGTIGVCLLGGHGAAATDSFGTHFTPDQDTALRGLIGDLIRKHGDMAVSGHNEYAVKGCPGFPVKRWLQVLPPAPVVERKPPGFWARLWRAIGGP